MKKRPVRFLASANADVKAIYDWIVEVSKANDLAEAFIMRIFDRCEQLSDFPEIGVARDDLSPGIRLLPFERRASIIYVVTDAEVRILNVLYRGRDYSDATFDIN